MGKYIIEGFDVERNGSYKCDYIDGFRLDRVPDNLNKDTKSKLINLLNQFLEDVKNNQKYMSGDWALHNLIFDKNLKNVDLEGFYSYETLPNWGNIKKINQWITNLIKLLQK